MSNFRRRLFVGCLACLWVQSLSVHGQTTGQIAGIARDQTGAVIVGAEVTILRQATGDRRTLTTDRVGRYVAHLLTPDTYDVVIAAPGFQTATFPGIHVDVTETTTIDAQLIPASVLESVTVSGVAPVIRTGGPQLGRVIDSHALSALPLATRNVTQVLALSPGAATYLPDNTGVGRNTQTISVNGARVTQNNFEIDGVDVNTMGTSGAITLPVPAPEAIAEFKVQTSLFDASFGRSGGANIQIVTRSGTNAFHGEGYDYFRHEALNANNPFLKAAGLPRPVLQRNVFGATLGGPIKKARTLFFISYEGTRETNGASILNSVSSDVLIAPGLTDDRSAAALTTLSNAVGGGGVVNSIAATLLRARLSNGDFVIPTPQANGRYSGSAISHFGEDQVSVTVDHHFSDRNSVSVRGFIANTPSTLALPTFRGTGPNVPGFGFDQRNDNRLIVVQDVHAFGTNVFNEARYGYDKNLNDIVPQEPLRDSDVGILRANADTFPGLPLIRIAPTAGGIVIGTPTNTTSAFPSVSTAADTLTIQRQQHTIRIGGEVRYNRLTSTANNFSRGQIDFANFLDFLVGKSSQSVLGNGIGDRDQRATDYNVFLQDDWRPTPKLTVNLGLRYELDLPVFEAAGRIATFDPALYQPRLAVDATGRPVGPPIGGFVQAGNVSPQYDVSGVPKADKRVVNSIDPNNIAPRIGFAYSPLDSGRFVVSAGYGLFYSRSTFQYVSTAVTIPPTYVVGRLMNPPTLADPFYPVPRADQFPTFDTKVPLAGTVMDRDILTPYVHQYNVSGQRELSRNLLVEAAYVGTRGGNLFRQVAINQAHLASSEHPIVNDVTGQVITTNMPGTNALLRAPFQGVSINGFTQNQTTGWSRYDSLQLSLTRRFTHGLQFLAAYTYARSTDNGSGQGGGAGVAGLVNPGGTGDTGGILGNQLDDQANRGVSDFDRMHRFVLSYVWDVAATFAERFPSWRPLLADWQISGVVTAMSGLPIDIVDSGAGSFYGLDGTPALARPNFAANSSCSAAMRDVPGGFFFNPFAFARPTVAAGQPIPSSGGLAIAGATGTDIGTVGRNCLRGPGQATVDVAVAKRFRIRQSPTFEMRAEFFNLFNQINFANPISDLNAVVSTGRLNATTGEIVSPGDFGRIISTSSNPRLIQVVLKISF